MNVKHKTDKGDLYPYAAAYKAFDEKERKVHVTRTGDVALCGISRGSYATGIYWDSVDLAWLNQEGWELFICLRCRKIALKILNSRQAD